MKSYVKPVITLAVAASLGLGIVIGNVQARNTYPPVDVLLSSSETVIGQRFAYPGGTPKITAAIVTMVPEQQTGWHQHDAPLFAHMLEGELTVDYGPDGTKSYKAGDSLIEAFKTPHNGTNTGQVPVRLIAVFVGADGVKNTVMEDH